MSNTPPTSFRLSPEVLSRLDLLSEHLRVVHMGKRISRATALTYLVLNAIDEDGMPTWRFHEEDQLDGPVQDSPQTVPGPDESS